MPRTAVCCSASSAAEAVTGFPASQRRDGNVGPPLNAIARRVYLAGSLPNTPDNMVRWIRSPKSIEPRTAMPDLQVTEKHARDMTAYLYRLQ